MALLIYKTSDEIGIELWKNNEKSRKNYWWKRLNIKIFSCYPSRWFVGFSIVHQKRFVKNPRITVYCIFGHSPLPTPCGSSVIEWSESPPGMLGSAGSALSFFQYIISCCINYSAFLIQYYRKKAAVILTSN